MLRSKRILFLLTILSIAISSCNLPAGGIPAGNPPDLAATITAQALLLQTPTQILVVAEVQAESIIPPATNMPEVVPSIIVTETPQPNSTVGMITVTVSAETNCRSGPNISYSSNYSLQIGQSAEVIGKNTPTNYWIINVPGKAGETCWLWGKYATVSGDTSGLKEYELPPTPTPKATVTSTPTTAALPPAVPSNMSQTNTCTLNPAGGSPRHLTTGTVTWQDNSNNEAGFNIYWYAGYIGNAADHLIGSVGPNSTSFGFNETTYPVEGNVIRVEAFNNAGASQRVSVNVVLSCPP